VQHQWFLGESLWDSGVEAPACAVGSIALETRVRTSYALVSCFSLAALSSERASKLLERPLRDGGPEACDFGLHLQLAAFQLVNGKIIGGRMRERLSDFGFERPVPFLQFHQMRS
jgi:hypothetical protein